MNKEERFKKDLNGKKFEFRPMTNSQELRLCMFGELVKDCFMSERKNLVVVKEVPAGATLSYVIGKHGDILYTQYDEPPVEPSWLKLPRRIAEKEESK